MNTKENTEVVNFILDTVYEGSFEPELAEKCKEIINGRINEISQSINSQLMIVLNDLTEALIIKDLTEKGFTKFKNPDDQWIKDLQREYQELIEQKRYFSNFEMRVYDSLTPYIKSEEDVKEIESIYDQF